MKEKQSSKVLEDNLTIRRILDKEELKDFADRIVSEDIDNILIIYRDVKNKSINWATTINEWARILGSLDMVHVLMMEAWENQRYKDEEEDEE